MCLVHLDYQVDYRNRSLNLCHIFDHRSKEGKASLWGNDSLGRLKLHPWAFSLDRFLHYRNDRLLTRFGIDPSGRIFPIPSIWECIHSCGSWRFKCLDWSGARSHNCNALRLICFLKANSSFRRQVQIFQSDRSYNYQTRSQNQFSIETFAFNPFCAL